MNRIDTKIAYLRGLAEGLKVNEDTKEGKLFLKLMEILDDISEEIRSVSENIQNMEEYMKIIDDDLTEVEDELFDVDYENDNFDYEDDELESEYDEWDFLDEEPMEENDVENVNFSEDEGDFCDCENRKGTCNGTK